MKRISTASRSEAARVRLPRGYSLARPTTKGGTRRPCQPTSLDGPNLFRPRPTEFRYSRANAYGLTTLTEVSNALVLGTIRSVGHGVSGAASGSMPTPGAAERRA